MLIITFHADRNVRFRPDADTAFVGIKGEDMGVACPCCGHMTMPDDGSFPGSFAICPVCFWEDDNVQLDDIDFAGGANQVSLRQARSNYRSFGAVDEQARPYVRSPKADEIPSSQGQH